MGKSNPEALIKSKEMEEMATKSLDSNFDVDYASAGSGNWDSEIKALFDNYTLKSLFLTEDWVFILLDLIASEISDVDMKVAKETFTSDGRNVVTWLDNHPLNKLIQRPNPNQDYSTWMYLHVVEYDLMGNAIQWFAESLNQLHIIPAENVAVDVNSSRELKKYIVHSQTGSNGVLESMTFPVDQILHQRRPNPVNTFWGLSPFVPNSKALLFNRYTQDYLNSFYLKQATGSMALSLDKQVSEEAALRLMRSFEHSYTGRRNQRRTMLLPKGVSITPISQTIADQNLIEIVNQNREKILNILRIPKHALSLAENGSLGSEEFKVSLKFMWTSAIKPTMKKIAGSFTDFFRSKGLLKDDEKFLFDISHIEILREDSLLTADLAIKQLEFKTLNEVRKDLYDLGPLDGGDETPTMISKDFELENFTTEDLEEYSDEDTTGILETKDLEIGEKNIKALMGKFGSWFEINQKSISDIVGKTENDFHKHMLTVFADMALRTVKDFKFFFKNKSYYGPKKLKAAVGSKDKLRKRLDESYGDIEDSYLEGYDDILFPGVETGYDNNLNSVSNDHTKESISELRDRDQDKRKASLHSRGMDSYGYISETTKDSVIDIITSGVEEGKSVDQISNDIIEGFAEFGSTRADTISQTESYTAISLGKKSALDNAVEIVPNMVKVWVNVGDEKVRGHPSGKKSKADHWVLQGEIVSAKGNDGKDNTFSNGLKYPRDVDSPKPEEKINCRCDMLMVRPEDLDQLSIARPKGK